MSSYYHPSDENTLVVQTGGFLGISMEFIARLLIASFFIFMGLRSAMNFGPYSQAIASAGLPYASLWAVISIILQLLGGLLFTGILAVYNSVGIGKLFLLIFMIITTALNNNAFKNGSEIENMLRNFAIIGGILLA